MAKKNGSNGEGMTETETETKKKVTPGAGYRRESSVTDAPWVANEKGNVCEGKLLGRYQMNVEPVRYYYQVELIRPTLARQGTGEDAEVIEVEAGHVVNLNETSQVAKALTERVVPEILAGAEYNIWVEFGDKIKLKGGGKTMWKVDVFSKQLKAPTRPVIALPKSQLEGEGASTPF
jgi:hypothetical protein